MRRLAPLAAALLACGLIAVGCGDDDDGNGDTSPAAIETTPGTTEAPDTAETTETPDTTDTTAVDNAIDQAVESCKQSAQSTQGLSDETRSDLEDICEQAAEGDEGALRDSLVEVCRKVVEETLPEGSPGRDEALDGCEQQSVPAP